jgi:hypothetical protein
MLKQAQQLVRLIGPLVSPMPLSSKVGRSMTFQLSSPPNEKRKPFFGCSISFTSSSSANLTFYIFRRCPTLPSLLWAYPPRPSCRLISMPLEPPGTDAAALLRRRYHLARILLASLDSLYLLLQWRHSARRFLSWEQVTALAPLACLGGHTYLSTA